MDDCYKLTVSFEKENVRSRKDTFVITKIKGDCVYAVPIKGGVEDFLFVYLKNIFLTKKTADIIQEIDDELSISLLFRKGNYSEENQISFQKKKEYDYKKFIDTVIDKIINKYLEFHRRYNHRLK